MSTYLRLTGIVHLAGAIDLNDNKNYALLDGWRPRVANRRASTMGNQLPWENVVENIPLRVFGASADVVLSKLHDLSLALDQANRWREGENLTAVKLAYRPDGSTLATPLQATVVGAVGDILNLPITFNKAIRAYEANPVILNLERIAAWLDTEESRSSSVATAPAVMSISAFTDTAHNFSPVDLRINLGSGAAIADRSAYIIASGKPGAIRKLENTAATLSGFSSHADSAASGGSVAKYNVGAGSGSLTFNGLAVNSDARLFQLFALVTNNSNIFSTTPTNYILSAFLQLGFAGRAYFNQVAVPHGSDAFGRSLAVPLGLVAVPDTPTALQLTAVPDATVAAGSELEVDYLVLVAAGEETNVLGINTFTDGGISNYQDYYVKHRLLEKPEPVFYQVISSDNDYTGATGNLLLGMTGVNYEVLLMPWRRTGFIVHGDYAITVTRRQAYLVPR